MTDKLIAFSISLILFCCAQASRAEAQDSQAQLTSFTEYSPLASNAELARRSLTPLSGERMAADLAAKHLRVREQPIDLGNEKFFVRLPASRPTKGYGALVYISPEDNARLPPGWGPILDHFGLIFVSAARSGNQQNPLARREPLAILAAVNLVKLYPVDPDRVFISGFSGGSRVAMRVALAYPDLFRGALLDAGSDAIGGMDVPLPPRDLFDRFRRASSLVYVTGALDEASLELESDSMASMRKWCVGNTFARHVPAQGHELMDGASLSSALSELTKPARVAPSAEACWLKAVAQVDARLTHAADLQRAGDAKQARDAINQIDRDYGGLAALELTSLFRKGGVQ